MTSSVGQPLATLHIPILVEAVLSHLAVGPGGHYVDATVNGGGHTRAILRASAPAGRVLAIDRDQDLIERLNRAEPALVRSGRLVPVASSFRCIADLVDEHSFGPVRGILFDLGLSSYHLDSSGRGFSFSKSEPLDMRFGAGEIQTQRAREILARAPTPELIRIFRELGEERFASRIARTIVARRQHQPVETTSDLLDAIGSSLPAKTRWRVARHAARVFQGLRIAVNDELETVRAALPNAWSALDHGGRMVVLAFHSLEDRIVKRYFRDLAQRGDGELLTRKPITASEAEVAENPRAASAKLRAIAKR